MFLTSILKYFSNLSDFNVIFNSYIIQNFKKDILICDTEFYIGKYSAYMRTYIVYGILLFHCFGKFHVIIIFIIN